MNYKYRCAFVNILALCMVLFTSTLNAEEGGAGHYMPGASATLIDIAPTEPGWILQPIYFHYDAEFSKTLPIAGGVSAGLKVATDVVSLGGVYTLKQKVLGSSYSLAAFVPFVTTEVTGNLRRISRTDKTSAIGDMTFIPLMMAWDNDNWQYDAILSVYAPTGDYEAGRLANTGLNYWTIEPTLGATYSNETTGLNILFRAGMTFNTENNDTNYKSGSVLHAETTVQQLFPLGKGIMGAGINGYIYEQITGDSGSGATLGDFKGSSLGIGPVLTYILPSEKGKWIFSAKWLAEVDREKRLEGDYVWLKAAWMF